jgi:tRNA-modifying protein YgfZ
MRTALLTDRGVLKVAGDGARNFLNGLVTADMRNVTPSEARFCALLMPQGKIIADFIVAEAPVKNGGGFFIDVARERAGTLLEKLNLYKLRAKVIVEDLSAILGVLVAWDGSRASQPGEPVGLCYADPRLPALGWRVMLPPHLCAAAAAEFGAAIVAAEEYEAHRIALGVPRGGVDFSYDDAFPHEADMDQLSGVDFDKGCYVGQEVVSRMEHRGTARTRAVPVSFEGAEPKAGTAIMAGNRQLGHVGSAAAGRGIALLRLDRAGEALAHGEPLVANGSSLRLVKPEWARFTFPGEGKAAE